MVTDKCAKERFFLACTTGDLESIKTDLFYKVSPFARDKYGNSALHLACMNNQPKVLEYILKTAKMYKNDVCNKLGRTALNIAASQGAFVCIHILLNNLKCDINSTDKNFKNTPLHWCVISKCVEGVQQLLNLGADFKLVNKFGQTPLQLAETTSLEIFNIIDEFVNKNKDQYLLGSPQIIYNSEQTNNVSPELLSSSLQYKTSNNPSKLKSCTSKKSINQSHYNNKTVLEPDLGLNNSRESFFLDISKLKDGDNSVLKLLEKSIEPVDETSFVSSILNSGKVIQLTEAGILALEYTKNEVNIPIPDRIVKSFLNTSNQYNENKNETDKNVPKEENDSKILNKGLKRLKNPLPSSKKFKCEETTTSKKSKFDDLMGQSGSKYSDNIPEVSNLNTAHCSQSFSTVEVNTVKNNEVCNKNQLVCLNSDVNSQPKWIEDLMCLLKDIVEHKKIEPAL